MRRKLDFEAFFDNLKLSFCGSGINAVFLNRDRDKLIEERQFVSILVEFF